MKDLNNPVVIYFVEDDRREEPLPAKDVKIF